MLVAISLPPLTDDTNRHSPSQAIPAARTPPRRRLGSRRARTGRRRRAGGSPPRRARRPAPRTPRRAPGRRLEPAQPAARGRVRNRQPRRGGPDPARPVGHLLEDRADRLHHIQSQPGRRQAAAHGSPRSAHSGPSARRPAGSGPPPGHNGDSPTRRPSAQSTTGTPGGETRRRGRPPHTRRPTTRTAIRWPRVTHRLGPLLAIGGKRGEKGSLTFWGRLILSRHARRVGRHRERARPTTRPGCSENHAANNRQPDPKLAAHVH